RRRSSRCILSGVRTWGPRRRAIPNPACWSWSRGSASATGSPPGRPGRAPPARARRARSRARDGDARDSSICFSEHLDYAFGGRIAAMRRFALATPGSVDECLRLLGQRGADTKLLAGGTDLLPQMKNGLTKPARVIDLAGVADLR